MHTEDFSDGKKVIKQFHLKHERELRGLTQSQVAEHIGTTQINVSRWENGITVPSPYYRQQLSELFGKSIQDLGLLHESNEEQERTMPQSSDSQTMSVASEAASLLPIFHVPYLRNPFFTGREDTLVRLHTALKSSKTASLTQAQAINGLGGIGKTQTAIEYAYRYREDYTAIFFINASTLDTLRNDYKTLATILGLPEHDDQEQEIVVRAVKHWLTTHSHWLLILDNVDDLEIIAKFLPEYGMGEVLLTTRLQALGMVAQSIEVKAMGQEEGMTFLLRRIKFIAHNRSFIDAPHDIQAQAANIVAELDGLPLALDQAGAYIEETRCGLPQYIHRYNTRRKELLRRRGKFPINHPDSIATTWSLSFNEVKQKSEAAAELLCVLAFLDPGSIPEEILAIGAGELGPVLAEKTSDPLEFDSIIELLLHYSLIQRNTENMSLSIHRLVQVVLKDTLDWDAQHLWAERAIRAVNCTFPYVDLRTVELRTWEQCQRCLPHVEACMQYVTEYSLIFPEAAELLNNAASFLILQGGYDYADSMLRTTLKLRQGILGDSHPDTARAFNGLGVLYLKQGKYREAEQLLQDALSIRQRMLGEKHPDVAETLTNLASSYYAEGDYAKAEMFYLNALVILENMSETTAILMAQNYYSLAKLYHSEEKYQQAQTLLEKALTMQRNSLGESHPAYASTLTMLTKVYTKQNNFAQAEKMSIHALMIRQSISGENHPHIATILNNLVEVYHAQERYGEAEPLIARSLKIHKQTLGVDHPYTAYSLTNQAENAVARGNYTQAESSYKQALAIREKKLGINHPRTAATYYQLAQLYAKVERFEEAEVCYQNALTIREHIFGSQHSAVKQVLEQYAYLLRMLSKVDEVQELEDRFPNL